MKCKCGCGKIIKPSLYYPKTMIIGGKKKIYQQREFCKGHRLPYKTKIIKCNNCKKKIRKNFSIHYAHLKHRFCSRKCTGEYRQRNSLHTFCYICKKNVIRKPCHQKKNKSGKYFCSFKCSKKYFSFLLKNRVKEQHPNWKPKIIKYCKICNKQMELSQWQKNQILCSSKCYAKWISLNYKGANASNWRGGISPEISIRCSSKQWKILRFHIYKRDNWTCQECGLKAKDYKNFPLQVHHIIPYRISKNDNSKNLITLCKWCHSKKEWLYRKSKNE